MNNQLSKLKSGLQNRYVINLFIFILFNKIFI